MNVLHISDIHFRRQYQPGNAYKNVLCTMQSPLKSLEICITHCKEKYKLPDLAVISGDLTEDGEPEDYAQLKAFLQAQLPDIPLVVTLGNHDNKVNFSKGWLNGEAVQNGYNAEILLKGIRILSFDSSLQGDPNGRITEKHTKWLRERLWKDPDHPVLLVTHHHLLDAHEAIPATEYPAAFAKLIRENQVIALLCGHTHHMFAGYFQEKPYYTSDGMSFCGEDTEEGTVRFSEKFGYNYYEIEGNQITHFTSETFNTAKVLAEFTWK